MLKGARDLEGASGGLSMSRREARRTQSCSSSIKGLSVEPRGFRQSRSRQLPAQHGDLFLACSELGRTVFICQCGNF